ncbi:MAG: HNH endonuclease [Spirochaetales bacterium]|jgi:putative restriction endonuclease|nr:HNH endonuclease [Spirochaetales bacterium]
MSDSETRIRLAAFQWLSDQVAVYGDVLPRILLLEGFEIDGERVTLISQKGIWKPKLFELIPLSNTTSPNDPYHDAPGDSLILYHYRKGDPNHMDNRGLREAMQTQTPLVYFYGIIPGKYLAVWPVFIAGDDTSAEIFTVVADEADQIDHWSIIPGTDISGEDAVRRRYVTAGVRVRLHQRSFRERILAAYKAHCAFCRIAHTELLDAAHIIPDGEDGGDPIVQNGLSLCKIHHAAFDHNLIGVNPDYGIEIRHDLLEEIDGPMLRHGIQALHQGKLYLPTEKKNWPDRDRLSIRFEQFLRVG